MRPAIKSKKYWELVMAMTEKEIKARYKNAFFGFLWVILNPLLQMLVIGLVFQNFISVSNNNYFLFIFPGLLLWNFFSYSLVKTTPSIVWERNLVQKAKFPREAIPLSIIFSNFFHLIISLSIFILVLVFLGQLAFLDSPKAIFHFFTSLLWILLLTCGLSLLSSALNVKYRDINFFVQAAVMLWFYATPILYSTSAFPSAFSWLFHLNPLSYPYEVFRSSLINTPTPPTSTLFTNLALSLVISTVGLVVFRKESKYFSDWL